MTSAQDFGQRLRLARERRGLSLEAVAASTNIKRSLLAELERGDVSKWPPGIYRRAFLRQYAAAVGLPAKAVVPEFLELFAEDGAPASVSAQPPGRLRLTLADDPVTATLHRLTAVAFELCVVLALAWAVARLSGSALLPVCGLVAWTYYPVAALCSNRIPAFGWPILVARIGSLRLPSVRRSFRLALHRTAVQSADERTA